MTLLWVTGREGKKTRFYGMGSLVGWLLASDYAYAGLVQAPEPSKVGEIMFKINAGGKSGLALLRFNVSTQEACAEAMRSLLNSEVRLIGHACAFRPHICRRRR